MTTVCLVIGRVLTRLDSVDLLTHRDASMLEFSATELIIDPNHKKTKKCAVLRTPSLDYPNDQNPLLDLVACCPGAKAHGLL